jgi:hypothetical protein
MASAQAFAKTKVPQSKVKPLTSFKKVFYIILENTNAEDALENKYLATLKKDGAYLDNFYAVTHPSQPNYVAMTSGDKHGVSGDGNVDLNVKNIADLLEAKGKTWKSYNDDYPGNCFLGATSGKYARKHVPFVSYKSISGNPARCAHIVNSAELTTDIQNGTLPDYSFFAPNLDNDGHDTGVDFSAEWLEKTFGQLFKDPRFMKDMLVVVTFDESGILSSILHGNKIYTLFLGDGIVPGTVIKTKYGFYDLLRTVEEGLSLGTLGYNDDKAQAITGVWR